MNRERKNNKIGNPLAPLAFPISLPHKQIGFVCWSTLMKRKTEPIPTQTQKNMNIHRHRHSQMINDCCPLCLKSHWSEPGSPNTRNSSRGRPEKSNILLHTSGEDRRRKSEDGGKAGGAKAVCDSVSEHILSSYILSNLTRFVPPRFKRLSKGDHAKKALKTKDVEQTYNNAVRIPEYNSFCCQ